MCDPNALPERVEFTPGERIAHFVIEQKMGEGTFGTVYKARDVKSNSIAAFKILKLWAVTAKERVQLNKRFKLEFETGRIDSEFLVHSYDYGCYKGNPYITMEFCPNGDLRPFIKNGMTLEQVRKFSIDVLFGLQSLHKNGKTHRDIKPENVLLTLNKRAKLTDFGIVGHANIQLTAMNWLGRPSQILGTYAYMPPEQIDPKSRKQTLLPTIDIFAFGVLCYEMLTGGKYPFGVLKEESDLPSYVTKVNKGEWYNIRKYRSDIPDQWVKMIEICLQPDYKKRFQNVDAILSFLGEATEMEEPTFSQEVDGKSKWGLKVMDGEEYGRVYNLAMLQKNREMCVLKLGVDDPEHNLINDIPVTELQSRYVSRAHASVERHADGYWYIRDGQYVMKGGLLDWHRSMNGTYVNGIEVGKNQGKRLEVGDIITVGNTTIKTIII
jgi:serine/threonine protein kinase